jgi:hypothetical protein
MYLGYRGYQLLFDLAGLVILLTVVAGLMVFAWLAYRRNSTAAKGLAVVVSALCMVQVYRGAMVTDSAWVVMLGAIENASDAERDQRVLDLRSKLAGADDASPRLVHRLEEVECLSRSVAAEGLRDASRVGAGGRSG